MNGQELATATQHGAASIILLLNNGMFGTIRMHQEREFPTHNMGSGLCNPHFANLAKAYGYEGVRISKTEEFELALVAALRAVKEDKKGTLIEVMMDPEAITTRVSLSTITQNALNSKQTSSS